MVAGDTFHGDLAPLVALGQEGVHVGGLGQGGGLVGGNGGDRVGLGQEGEEGKQEDVELHFEGDECGDVALLTGALDERAV